MAITEEWPVGQRHAHHGLDAHRSQREQALLWRAHHTEDAHTHDGDYAAIDEAFTRLDTLERPTTERRLFRLRKLAEARKIRRQYNREANWLVANREHLHYQHRLMQHTRWPDQHAHPGTTGLALRDEDTSRIGPTTADIDVECDARIDDLRPRISELLLYQAAGKLVFPGSTDRVIHQIAAHAAIVELQRERARFLKVLASVRDDYFEPKHWGTINTALRTYTRLAQLGIPATDADAWHALADTGLAMGTTHDDLLAVCRCVTRAQDLAASYPVWTDATDLPTPSVNVTPPATVSIAWSGALPSGVALHAILVQSTILQVGAPIERTLTEPQNLSIAGDRIAITVQFTKAPTTYTPATFAYVGDLT